ncbi:MAG: hypothetical protein LBP68_04705 [Acidobacteriota bacterium]|jgi:hypothetical protein|nr:hypothetical protein [Acidobacteriota bacterium]
MSLAIVDAREWQNLLDLRTGKKVQIDPNNKDERARMPQTAMLRDILHRHPYPGDGDIRSNRWVTDSALDLIAAYEPQLACVIYGHQYFAGRYTPMTDDARRRMMEDLFSEIDRFVTQSGYAPVIVGTGEMIPLAGEIDLVNLDGLAISSHWSARYAGLHHATPRDLDHVRSLPEVERIVGRDEWIATFPGAAVQPERVPEHLLLAAEGWTYVTTGTPMRRAVRVPGKSFQIPLATELGEAAALTDIRNLIYASASKGKKVALIVAEGVGMKDFLMPFVPCSNQTDWHYYEPGDGFYLTLSTGTHQVFAYPSGYNYLDETDDKKDLPFSGYFLDLPAHALGDDFLGKSVAVGNHSMFVHTVFGADVCMECFARNLYNQGGFGVIHRFR